MKSPPTDDETMVECPLCGQVLTYGDARELQLHPSMTEDDGPAALQASGVLECRCGRSAVTIERRGTMKLVIPRAGITLGGTVGPDTSVVV